MKLQDFIVSRQTELIQIYITERTNNGYGVLYINLTNKSKADVSFVPINSDILSEDLKKDILEKKSKGPDSLAFFYGTELNDNNQPETILIQFDLAHK